MKINPSIFKAYDIRGIYPDDLNKDTAYKLGVAFANLVSEEIGKEKITLTVGGDMRLSTPELKKSLIKGITEAGASVVDIGLVSTPTFYFGVSHLNTDGGIIVSASHNPKEWNGFKLTRDKAKPVSFETGIRELKKRIEKDKLSLSNTKGEVKTNSEILKAQIEHDFKFFNLDKINSFKVAVDPANGMGAQYMEVMFKNLPIRSVKMNFDIDGTFPSHEADPIKKENLVDLKKKVVEESCDLGIAIDGDGDRVFFIDDKGEAIDQSIIRGILAKLFLEEKPGSKICYDIRPGRITRDLIEENGGVPIVTPVGHSLIKAKTLEEGAYFAGESSGHFFLNMEAGCFEVPVIIIGKLLEEFSRAGEKVSEYIKPYQKYYHSGEINSEVEDKEKVFQKLEKKYNDGKINKLDGVTVEFPDFWFNVRGSNTEEKVRLNLEARDEKTMKEKRDEILKIILNA